MIKSEPKTDRVLRSASPHRNAYKSDFHSIKCSFEGPSVLYSYGGNEARGRPSGSRVNEIKNIFLQMDAQQTQDSTNQTKPGTAKLQLSSTSYRSSMGSASSTESGTSEVVRKSEDIISFDKVTLAEKFSETRKLFESGIPTDRSAAGRSVSRSSVRSVSEVGRYVRKLSEKTDQIQIIGEQPKKDKDRGEPERETPPHKPAIMKNAGPISRRLESFMLDSDSESLSGPSVSTRSQSPSSHSQPPSSPNSEHSDPPLSPDSDGSPTSYSLWPESPSVQADANLNSPCESQYSPTPVNGVCAGESPHWSSHSTNTTMNNANESSVSVVSTEPPILFKSEKRHCLSLSSGSVSSSAEGHECLEMNVSKVKHRKGEFGTPALSTVRAELVVVHNESSEGESNEEDRIMDDVFEDVKNEQPPTNLPLKKELIDSKGIQILNHEDKSGRDFRIEEEKNKERINGTMGTENKDREGEEKLAKDKSLHEEKQKEEEEDEKVKAVQDKEGQVQEESYPLKEMKAEQIEKESAMQNERREAEENVEDVDVGKEAFEEEDDEHDVEEVTVKEGQEQVSEDSAGRPLICGIENAAFVDDRESKLDFQQKEQHTGPNCDHFQEYEELPGLSDEEELSSRRRIRFSTAPIKVWPT